MKIMLNVAPADSFDVPLYADLGRQVQPWRKLAGWSPSPVMGDAMLPDGQIQGPAWSIVRDGTHLDGGVSIAGTYRNDAPYVVRVTVGLAAGSPTEEIGPGATFDVPLGVRSIQFAIGLDGSVVLNPSIKRVDTEGILQPGVIPMFQRFDAVRFMEPHEVQHRDGMRELLPSARTWTQKGPDWNSTGRALQEIGREAVVCLDLDTAQDEARIRSVLAELRDVTTIPLIAVVGNETWNNRFAESQRLRSLATSNGDDSARFHAGNQLHAEMTLRLAQACLDFPGIRSGYETFSGAVPDATALYQGSGAELLFENGYLHFDTAPDMATLQGWTERVEAQRANGTYEALFHPREHTDGSVLIAWSKTQECYDLTRAHLAACEAMGHEFYGAYCSERERRATDPNRAWCFGLRTGLLEESDDQRYRALVDYMVERGPIDTPDIPGDVPDRDEPDTVTVSRADLEDVNRQLRRALRINRAMLGGRE